jgi:hypothetical protein
MLSKTEKINLSTVEIAKRIRKQLKSEFSNCMFSVTTENFAGGSSININLMKADTKMVQDFQDIPEDAPDLLGIGYTKEDIKLRQLQKYHQLNKFTLRGEYNPSTWCNGVFLTEQGHDLLRRVARIAEDFNFDDSDPQTDYSFVNFHLDLELGKWNKDFKDGGKDKR